MPKLPSLYLFKSYSVVLELHGLGSDVDWEYLAHGPSACHSSSPGDQITPWIFDNSMSCKNKPPQAKAGSFAC
jgi:hypothetical protein